jgi:hypothetical protein
MKPKYFLFFCFSFLIFNSSLLITHATVRFVSKTGTSTPPYTSWQTAADSIQKCINICVDGDTVYVANGIYKENLLINTKIFLCGLSMDSTVIDGTGLAVITVEYLSGEGGEIKNFKIIGKGFNQGATILTRRNILIKNCRMTSDQTGLSVINTSVITENLIIDQISKGIFAGCLNGDCNTVIKNSLILLNASSSTALSINIGGTYYIDNNILIFNNEIDYSGHGISCGAPSRIYIRNNLISGFSFRNIFLDIIQDSAFIQNNISTHSLKPTGMGSIGSTANNVTIHNTILLKNIAGISGDNKVKSNYNLFWKNIEGDLSGLTYGDSDIVANPMFVNDTIPTANGNYDFHLQKYSPAIDKGDPSILDVDGSRSDIGLFGGPLGESYTYQDLAPKPPGYLTASMDSGLVHLKWNKNTEADFFRYRVYRDTVPDFIYDTTKIIAVLSDTTFYDDPPQKFISGNYYYKITAIDSAYHQSPASGEAHINITGIPEAPPIVVEHYNLLQNYPNPFNPSTTIPYRLKAPGYVKVMVYNLLGEQVKVLVNKYQSAGYYEVLFHPTVTERQSAEGKIEFETGYGDIVSGIYLYRIEVIGEGNIPVFTDMKKMMLVK